MKRLLLFSLIILLNQSFCCYAEPIDIDTLAKKYLDMTIYKEKRNKLIDETVSNLHKIHRRKLAYNEMNDDQYAMYKKHMKAVIAAFLENFKWEKVENHFVDLVKAEYTKDQLVDVIKLLESEPGQLLLKKDRKVSYRFDYLIQDVWKTLPEEIESDIIRILTE